MPSGTPRPYGGAFEMTFSRGLKFTCTRCAACCKHVGAGIGTTESDSLALGVLARPRDNHPIFTGTLDSEGGACSLLSGDDCSVYRERPLVCRLYPFYVGVKADGTIQVSVDHCPGVNLPEAELIDEEYVSREVLDPVAEDGSFISKLRDQIMQRKGDSLNLVESERAVVRGTWGARERLWEGVFSFVCGTMPPHFTPRDRLECLKADLVPWIEERMLLPHSGALVDEVLLEGEFSRRREEIQEIVSGSAKAQATHRLSLEADGRPTGGGDLEYTTFRLRTGDSFRVTTAEALRMRGMTPAAREAEMDYIKEVFRREFVYRGVVVPSLTFRQEASLFYYLSDAIEFMANAASSRDRLQRVDLPQMNMAICEVDAHILTTVDELGVSVPLSGT